MFKMYKNNFNLVMYILNEMLISTKLSDTVCYDNDVTLVELYII